MASEPVSWRGFPNRAAQEGPCNNIFRRGHESSALINKQRDCAGGLKIVCRWRSEAFGRTILFYGDQRSATVPEIRVGKDLPSDLADTLEMQITRRGN